MFLLIKLIKLHHFKVKVIELINKDKLLLRKVFFF